MKSYSWICRCHAIEGDRAFVSMRNRDTGAQTDAECRLADLTSKGIGVDDEFMCLLVQRPKGWLVKLRRLKPRPITPERVREIKAEFEAKGWNFP